ncbi:MAG: acyltransferase, partial [Candidatus Omnitrophica bacterium]|nr:acyltransferase [Candidatus Omnitrophota bacterium]
GSIKIGNNLSLNNNVMISSGNAGDITIGDNVLIGPNVVIRASNHAYAEKDIPINKQGHIGGRVIIEDDVWIGANVVILPKAVIRKGAVVGAGSVVNSEIAGYSLAAGVPAKAVKNNMRR